MAEPIVKIYSHSQFIQLLAMFQGAVDCGEYTEKIPYDTWRKLKKMSGDVKVEYSSPFVKISVDVMSIDGSIKDTVIFSTKTYNNGFGRFFYDYIVKEKAQMNLSTNTTAYSAETTKIAGDPVMSVSGSIDIDWNSITDGISIATGKTNSNYGTTITDNTRLNADRLVHDGYSNTISTDHCMSTWIGVADTKADKADLDALEKRLDEYLKKEDKNKCEENNTMMKGINFDFGPCGNTVRLSMYGMAIQNVSNEWVSYNPDSKEIINVDVFNMADGGKYMYKMPVAISEVKEGDIVIHNRVPMFVTAINENGTFEVTDVRAGETKNIIPTRNMFGFNFMTKVVSLFGAFTDAPTADQPFGNMLPFLMMGGDNKDIDPMMMFFMMNQGGTNVMANPMMMYFMMKDNKDFDPMMLMFMMNQPQPHACHCGKHAEKPVIQA
jgi:hypothetical protein